ncbi:MAG: DNA methylase [Bacilli bacterium]|nr:DNA methylase [Bacilli bacterium]
MSKVYMCIDLKSFYASVECKERNLDPLDTNLVVADNSRTEKTVCLAVTPSLKSYGIKGRARLFEVIAKVREVNYERKKKTKNYKFSGKSFIASKLKDDLNLELDYIIAPPRMALYIEYSTKIYDTYLKYVAPEDIYVYSIDEVFIDITDYLKTYQLEPKELVTKMIKDVYERTGITATAGIGTNLFLCKVAMDIVAKHTEPNEFGVRVAELDEKSYRKLLWTHTPLTDFWRVGQGYAKKLESYNLYTMGDIARCSIKNESLLYKLFGVNAELLIDHAWGYEPCTIKDVKTYKPAANSISSGQVLHEPYTYKKTKIIVKEMTDLLVLDLVKKKMVTDQIILTINYDIECLTNPTISKKYTGEITTDHYGRKIPKHSHGTINLDYKTSSTEKIMNKTEELFEKIINKDLLVRKVNICFAKLENESIYKVKPKYKQIDLFNSYEEQDIMTQQDLEKQNDERKLQETVLKIKDRYGKNSILKGMNLEEGATTIDRNKQIGGHKA